MLSGIQRRSMRIFELEARKAEQDKSKNEKKGTEQVESKEENGTELAESKNEEKGTKLEGAQETGTKKGSKTKCSRKRKTRPVRGLVDKFQDNTLSGLHSAAGAAAGMSYEIPLPDKEKLVLMLDKLKWKDSYEIFAKPVDPNEVEGYYDIIKEPMDFSTIAKKIDEECYKTLNEFEHDIYLVYSNAMYFNAPDTIYYKQAVGIRYLAERLFNVLITDPKNLKPEWGKEKTKGVGQKKGDAECSNTCDKTTDWSNEQESQESLPLWRCTYNPHASSGNESFMAKVLKSSKKLELENKFNYSRSLIRFAKDLGPTAQMVAMRKLGGGVAETSTQQIAASNFNLQTPSNQIHAVTFPNQEINTNLSFTFLKNSAGCQRKSGGELGIQSNTLKGRAFAVETTNIYDVSQGDIANTSCTMKALSDVHGIMIQAPKNQARTAVSVQQSGGVPSSRLPAFSAGSYAFSGKEFDIRSGTNQGKVNTMNISDALNKEITQASSKNKNIGDFQDKMFQIMSGGVNINTACKEKISTAGDRKLDVIEELNTESNPTKFNFVKLLLDDDNRLDLTDEVVFSGSNKQKLVPGINSCPSSSWQWPSQSKTEGSSRGGAVGFMHEDNSLHLGRTHPQAMVDGEGPSIGGNIEQGGLVSDWFKLNVPEGLSSIQAFGSMLGLGSHYPGGFYQIQATNNQSGLIHRGNVQQGGQVSNWFKPIGLGVQEAGSSDSGNEKYERQIYNWFKPMELGLEILDAASPSHGDGLKHGGQISSWFKPTELGLELIPDASGLSQGGNVRHEGQISRWFKPTELGLELIPDAAGLSQGGNMEHEGQILNWFKPTELGLEPIPDEAGLSQAGNVEHGGQISDWFKPTEFGLEPVPDAANPNYAGNVKHGGQISNLFKLKPDAAGPNHEHGGELSNCFKPTELGPEPFTDDFLAEAEMNILNQAGPEHGALKIGTPADNLEKKPLEVPFIQQWTL